MNDTTRHTRIATELGDLLLVARDEHLVGLYFPGHWRPPAADALGAQVNAADDPVFAATSQQLTEYLDGRRTEFDLPLATAGDEFSERVWALLRDIPYGETITYGHIAHQLGARELAQLVGRAVGDNPISVVVPCHRVVGAGGALTGYAGGLARKRHLLDLETAYARLF
jgi:methylated-DNA-[protein]-cysteine S-methyltransferase